MTNNYGGADYATVQVATVQNDDSQTQTCQETFCSPCVLLYTFGLVAGNALLGWGLAAAAAGYMDPCIKKPNEHAVQLCAMRSTTAIVGAYVGAIVGGGLASLFYCCPKARGCVEDVVGCCAGALLSVCSN